MIPNRVNIPDFNRSLNEAVARKIAIANHGGDWADHYTEEQKAVWRERAAEIIYLIETQTGDVK